MKEKILITICARSGSKGVPDKNIKNVAGIPLIGYSINLAKKIAKFYNVDIAISTDSDKYLLMAKKFGVETDYIRPGYLATSNSGKMDVFKDVLDYYEKQNGIRYDYLIDLEVTSPLRNLKDFENAFNIIKNNKEALVVYGATLSTKNPYYNLVQENQNGYYELCIKSKESLVTRQSAPKVYESNGMLYLFRREFFNEPRKTFFTDRTLIYPAPHICFDIDVPVDFEFIDFLIKNNKLDFDINA